MLKPLNGCKEAKKMTEKEKIQQLLDTHKALFEVTDMDVAQSMKGVYFFRHTGRKTLDIILLGIKPFGL